MPSRWLQIWANVTVAGTIVLLVLGAVVSSFRVGMADPIWPTEPWRLALVDWSEPSRGFLIEHTHRLAGFTVGGLMTVLAFGLWWTESLPKLRWGGLLSLVGLVGAFGYLHGMLIAQTKTLTPGSPLSLPLATTGILVLALTAVLIATVATAYRHSPGWGLRLLAVVLLIGVMMQGLLGGLRVHLDAMLGKGLSVVHGSFSQVVFGLTVLIALTCLRTSNRRVIALSSETRAWSLVAIAAIYAQIVAGAVLRHTTSPFGPRLHLMLAFIGVVAVVITCGRLWRANCARGWVVGMLALVAGQLLLGVESWLIRFSDGFALAELRRITEPDAWLRTGHAVVGYLLFAMTIVLAVRVHRLGTTGLNRIDDNVLEGVA
jgi:heme a synthase